jgi:hypothetical protein
VAEPIPPARPLDVFPLEPVQPGNIAVRVLCVCGGLTDVEYEPGHPPAMVRCAGCGAELEAPG